MTLNRAILGSSSQPSSPEALLAMEPSALVAAIAAGSVDAQLGPLAAVETRPDVRDAIALRTAVLTKRG